MNYTVLYRGDLSSCNYSCSYCPFAGNTSEDSELEKDKASLRTFCQWLERQMDSFSIFFTPRGEALTRKWYKESFIDLSHKKNIKKVVIQTNFSCDTNWIKECNPMSSAFWLTFHPDEISAPDFVNKCMQVHHMGIPFSVGVVAIKKNYPVIQHVRSLLPDNIYLWVNAFKRSPNYYSQNEIDFLNKIDPLFSLNLPHYKSFGKHCHTGDSVFSIDGDGNIRRCHFTDEIIGNISHQTLDQVSSIKTCPNKTCHCHIGYVYLHDLNLKKIFGDWILERIPKRFAK